MSKKVRRRAGDHKFSIASYDAEIEQISQAARYLAGIPDGVERAVLNAMRRAILEARTAGARKVREVYAVKYGDILRSFCMTRRPSRNDLTGEITSRGSKLMINKFRYRPTHDTTGNRHRPVRVSVKKEGGLKPLGQAFVHEGKVFQRLGKPSYPIRPVYALAIPQMLDNVEVVKTVQGTMVNRTNARLDHEIYRLLNGFEGHAKWRD